MQKVPTPGKTTCEDVAKLLKMDLQRTVKAVAVMHDDEFHLLLIRGDHDLNEIKTQKTIGAFRFAGEKEIERALHCKAGYIGPVGAKVKIVADRSVAAMSDFVCGANEEGKRPIFATWSPATRARTAGEPSRSRAASRSGTSSSCAPSIRRR
jgi:prolyl-tRNA synthetase